MHQILTAVTKFLRLVIRLDSYSSCSSFCLDTFVADDVSRASDHVPKGLLSELDISVGETDPEVNSSNLQFYAYPPIFFCDSSII